MKTCLQAINDTLLLLAALKSVPRWQRNAEAKLAARLARLNNRAMQSALSLLVDAGLPSSEMDRRLIVEALGAIRGEMLEEIDGAVVDAARHGRNRMIDSMRKQGANIPKPEGVPAQIETFLRQKTVIASSRTLDRLTGNVMESLAESYRDGLGIRDAGNALRDVFQSMEDYELTRVARTEIHGAQSDAAHMTIDEYGVEYKQWITADDDRVRDRHIDLHGEIARSGMAYSNGMMYPGDRNGDLEDWINCRCREVPFLMPAGVHPPPGKDWFREDELITT